MSVTTYLIVGLGNPEGKYFQTYHNIGFLAADSLAARLDLWFKKKGNQLIADFRSPISGARVFLLKPLTYMNQSGQAVVAATRKHKIPTENVLVFVDDLYIDRGNIRISTGGSGGGHNGLKSITELLQTNVYTKIRIGIRPDKAPKSGHRNFVLSKIEENSRPEIDAAIEKAVNCALSIVGGDTISKMQGLYNTSNAAPSPPLPK